MSGTMMLTPIKWKFWVSAWEQRANYRARGLYIPFLAHHNLLPSLKSIACWVRIIFALNMDMRIPSLGHISQTPQKCVDPNAEKSIIGNFHHIQ